MSGWGPPNGQFSVLWPSPLSRTQASHLTIVMRDAPDPVIRDPHSARNTRDYGMRDLDRYASATECLPGPALDQLSVESIAATTRSTSRSNSGLKAPVAVA